MPEIGTQTRQPEGLPIAIPVETRPVFNVRRFIPIFIVILCVFVAFITNAYQGDVSGVNSAVTMEHIKMLESKIANDENHDIEPPYECKPEDATEKKVQGNYIEQFANLKVVNEQADCENRHICEQKRSWITENPTPFKTPGDAFNVPIKVFYFLTIYHFHIKHSWAIIRPDALDTGSKIPRYRLNMKNKHYNQEDALLLNYRLGGKYTLKMKEEKKGLYNFGGFLQTKCIHRGPYKKFESYIYDCIKSHNSSAIAKWDIHYISNSFGLFDPVTEVHYTVWFEKGCESKSMLFKNPM